MRLQKGSQALCLAAASLIAAVAGAADNPAPLQLRYALPPGKTNAYSLTITMQGESGRETMTGTMLVSTRKEGAYVAISVKGQMRPKMTPGSPMMMGYRPGAPASLNTFLGYAYGPMTEPREMVIDETGRVLRLRGDSALPIPLGSVLTSFLTPVPAEPTAGWEKDEYVYMLDEPLLAGPLVASLQNFGPMYYGPGRSAQGTIAARQKTSVKVTGSTGETVTLEKTCTLETPMRTGNEPRISGSSKAKIAFDRDEGWPRSVELEAKSAALTENLSRSSLLSLTWQLLEGAERETALAPPPPPRPQEIPAVDIPKLMANLESDDPFTRENAARELTMGGRTVKPTPELMALAAKLATDRDDTVRHAGQTLLANYGTREDVPLLLRALKESGDSSVRMTLVKGLGRLEDPRAAEPLAELIAAGQGDQSPYFRRESPVADALVKIGPPAENAVLTLLKQKHTDTRIIACNVLKQIGTKKSLSALKELTGDPVKELSEAAAEAVRSIQGREKAN
jgi:HEAT repeat protein